MCGIIAYSGFRDAVDVIIEGLKRLEYRGYDSAGLGVLSHGKIQLRKCSGRITSLQDLLSRSPVTGNTGIGHTRWATHGAPTDTNSHPHASSDGKLILAHNGVIENYKVLKEKLESLGHVFKSETDTEVLAHLVGYFYSKQQAGKNRLVRAVKQALSEVEGTYGIAVMHEDEPGKVVGARRGSPLVLGLGEGENFLSSDVSAMVSFTRDVVYLNDGDVVEMDERSYNLSSLFSGSVSRQKSRVEWDAEDAQLGLYPHYMLKEIFEQPTALRNVMRGRLNWEQSDAKLGGLQDLKLSSVKRILILGCGTALHAGKMGEYIIEELSGVPVETDFSSEFRYRNSPIDDGTLVFVISQSGETVDSLAAMREVQRKGVKAFGLVNVVGSTIARESDGGVYLHAGPEIGVAATKSFTSQVVALTLIGLALGRSRTLSAREGSEILSALQRLPETVERLLEKSEEIKKAALNYITAKNMLFLGRLANYPAAMEGALKLKEISYIHAEAYPSAELKHGVIALISPDVPTVLIATRDGVYEKNKSTLQEIKARGGKVITIALENDDDISEHADTVITVPETHHIIQPVINVIALQLFAYHLAVALGRDVDKPRNLAKSVTVE
jgi:glucosamine--fructose-6-phosphate aminotransferase (isomerizing)